jgi:hypothetical protein
LVTKQTLCDTIAENLSELCPENVALVANKWEKSIANIIDSETAFRNYFFE